MLARDADGISRAELARRMGLSRTALGARLDALKALRLIEDGGRGASSGGRPPGLVRFSADSGITVGVDFGATSVDVAISDLAMAPLAQAGENLDIGLGPAAVLERAATLVDDLLTQTGGERGDLRGVGVGLPGPVEFGAGRPVAPPIMAGWNGFGVREYFSERYSAPAFVDNDANVMALGELWAGHLRGAQNALWIKLGTGIGCGIVAAGEVFRGTDGCAGDIGHIAVGSDTTECRCGNVGCLEAIAGGRALGQAAERLARDGSSTVLARHLEERGSLTAQHLVLALAEGDAAAVELVRAAGTAIGTVLAGLVNFHNPRLIVLGGGLTGLGDGLLASVRETVYRRSTPLATRELTITTSALDGRAGVVGAAAMVLSELYRLRPVA